MKLSAVIAVLTLTMLAGCARYMVVDRHYGDCLRGYNAWGSDANATKHWTYAGAWLAATEYRWSRRGQAWYGGGPPILCIEIERVTPTIERTPTP